MNYDEKKAQKRKDIAAIIAMIVDAEMGGRILSDALLEFISDVREEFDTRIDVLITKHAAMNRAAFVKYLKGLGNQRVFAEKILLEMLEPEKKT